MNKERLEEIKAANKARTPGKWFWDGFVANGDFELRTFAPNNRGVTTTQTVMSFDRWGMRNAQPVFKRTGETTLTQSKEMLIIEGADTCSPRIVGIDSPDAKFIPAAAQYVTELLELADEQAAELEEAKRELKDAKGAIALVEKSELNYRELYEQAMRDYAPDNLIATRKRIEELIVECDIEGVPV